MKKDFQARLTLTPVLGFMPTPASLDDRFEVRVHGAPAQ